MTVAEREPSAIELMEAATAGYAEAVTAHLDMVHGILETTVNGWFYRHTTPVVATFVEFLAWLRAAVAESVRVYRALREMVL